MRNQRLLVIGLLIAVAVVWLLVVLPRPHADAPPRRAAAEAVIRPSPMTAPAPVTATAEAPARAARPAPRPMAVAEPPAADAEPESEPAKVADEAPPEPEPMAKVPPADPEEAADLFAEQIAKQEAESEEGHLPNAARDLWKRFDKEEADREWASAAERHLQETLSAWIGALPEGSNQHLVLVHVECRATLCQVLAADNDLDGQNTRAETGQEWQQAIASLGQQPWWAETGFTDLTTQVSTNEGYVLYTTYLLRSAAPAAP